MKWLRRLLGGVVLLLSAAVFVGCLAGIVGIWMFQRAASQKVEYAATQLDLALQRLTAADKKVEQALAEARAQVDRVRLESANLGGGAEQNQLTTFLLRRMLRQDAGPKLYDLEGRLAMFADAAVAASSLLRSLEETQLPTGSHVKPEDLERAAARAAQLSAGLQKLQTTVGEDGNPAVERQVVAAAHDVDVVLEECQATVADWQSHLDAVGTELPRLKARILGWLLLTAVGVTVLCVWFALSQISLFAHAWTWCFGP